MLGDFSGHLDPIVDDAAADVVIAAAAAAAWMELDNRACWVGVPVQWYCNLPK